MSSTQTYKFKADITCQACVNAIQKSLKKTYGDELQSVDSNVENKDVTIVLVRQSNNEPYTYDQVYEALAKTGPFPELCVPQFGKSLGIYMSSDVT
ncbi:Cytosolic copper metallochaperone [Dermatophagoides farinae]|uniref:Cytosolic copper metallochaperone n=1 Tax=Dermatophagoides farinae TaxID=6954 RepID=A0A922L886_DERFA|nr:Cytosolic copper metallochaperone [Dermatophagoides farinae]